MKKYQKGGFSTEGYRSNSPDRDKPFNIIPSGNISMVNVPHEVLGQDNLGNIIRMQPGKQYQFPGNNVFEVPLRYNNMDNKMQNGGYASASGHPGQFWDGSKWVTASGTGGYSGGVYYQMGGNTLLSDKDYSPDEMKKGGAHKGKKKLTPQQIQMMMQAMQQQQMQQQGIAGQQQQPQQGMPFQQGSSQPMNPQDMQMIQQQQMQQGQGIAPPMQKYGGSNIHIKKSHEGKFTEYKKRTGKTTEEATHSSDPRVRKMAIFAQNAAKWHHQYGGPSNFYQDGGMTNGQLDPQVNSIVPQQNNQPVQNTNNNFATYYNNGMSLLGAGIIGAEAIGERNNQRNDQAYTRQLGMTSNFPVMTQPGSHGNYSVNSGTFRPDQMTPENAGIYYPKMEDGGVPPITPQDRSNWNMAAQQYMQQPNYNSDAYNHNYLGRQFLSNYNQGNPGNQVPVGNVAPIQQSLQQIYQNPLLRAPNGVSRVDNYPGTQTLSERFPLVQYNHLDKNGNLLGSKNYGTNYEQSAAENTGGNNFWNMPQQPSQQVAQTQQPLTQPIISIPGSNSYTGGISIRNKDGQTEQVAFNSDKERRQYIQQRGHLHMTGNNEFESTMKMGGKAKIGKYGGQQTGNAYSLDVSSPSSGTASNQSQTNPYAKVGNTLPEAITKKQRDYIAGEFYDIEHPDLIELSKKGYEYKIIQ